jgi:hypothetical protein
MVGSANRCADHSPDLRLGAAPGVGHPDATSASFLADTYTLSSIRRRSTTVPNLPDGGTTSGSPIAASLTPLLRRVPDSVYNPAPTQPLSPPPSSFDLLQMLAGPLPPLQLPEAHFMAEHHPALFVFGTHCAPTPTPRPASTSSAKRRNRIRRTAYRMATNLRPTQPPDDVSPDALAFKTDARTKRARPTSPVPTRTASSDVRQWTDPPPPKLRPNWGYFPPADGTAGPPHMPRGTFTTSTPGALPAAPHFDVPSWPDLRPSSPSWPPPDSPPAVALVPHDELDWFGTDPPMDMSSWPDFPPTSPTWAPTDPPSAFVPVPLGLLHRLRLDSPPRTLLPRPPPTVAEPTTGAHAGPPLPGATPLSPTTSVAPQRDAFPPTHRARSSSPGPRSSPPGGRSPPPSPGQTSPCSGSPPGRPTYLFDHTGGYCLTPEDLEALRLCTLEATTSLASAQAARFDAELAALRDECTHIHDTARGSLSASPAHSARIQAIRTEITRRRAAGWFGVEPSPPALARRVGCLEGLVMAQTLRCWLELGTAQTARCWPDRVASSVGTRGSLDQAP